jgi:hypothetical protein
MKRMIVPIIVIFIAAAAAGAADEAFALERSAVVIGSRVQMHESASGDSPVVGLLSEGVTVSILGRTEKPADVGGFTDYWYGVGYRGRSGWVFGQFISPATEGRGLARIFTPREMTDYCDRAAQNLIALRNAGLFGALVDASGRLSADIEEMAADPILSPYGRELAPYRLLAAWSLAAGYAGTGEAAKAEKIRDQLSAYDPGTMLPDGTALDARIGELEEMIKAGGGTAR